MVTVKNVHQRKSAQGKPFVTLELTGELEFVQSQTTGRFYAAAKRCFIASNFEFEQAKQFLGQKLPGNIVRTSCEPYEYILPENGETITLAYTYSYQPNEEKRTTHNEHAFEEIAMEI